PLSRGRRTTAPPLHRGFSGHPRLPGHPRPDPTDANALTLTAERHARSATDPEFVRKFDIYDPAVAADPHAAWKQLRDQCPVAHSEAQGGDWVLTRYADVVSAAGDPRHSSPKPIPVPRQWAGTELAAGPPITYDPPRHIPYRRLVRPGFSTRQ